MNDFGPEHLEAGKKYMCRDGSTVTLRQHPTCESLLVSKEFHHVYDAEDEAGLSVLHPKDIIGFAPEGE